MPTTTQIKKKTVPAPNSAKTVKSAKPTTPAPARMTLAQAMTALEKAGSAQTRKTYLRHGAIEPMFGVSFATLKTMVKQIGVDQELALALWNTGNHDARTLAVKIADPSRMTTSDLDRWAKVQSGRMCGAYVGYLVSEGPHARSRSDAWLAAPDEPRRCCGWQLVGALAMCDEDTPDTWFGEHLAKIEKSIQSAPNMERASMLTALIAIGCRSAALRKSVTAAAKRLGKIEIDQGDTDCKTPEVVPTLEKTWTYAASKGFASPAAQERAREPMRTRC